MDFREGEMKKILIVTGLIFAAVIITLLKISYDIKINLVGR